MDIAMTPLMWVIGGCSRASLQETHFWHCAPVERSRISEPLGVVIHGDDPSTATSQLWPLPLFHIPILGGWTHYAVLQVAESQHPWHIGWIYQDVPPGFRLRNHLQILPIHDDRVRVLTMPAGCKTLFFGVDPNGRQIRIEEVGRGRLGDRQHRDVRLF